METVYRGTQRLTLEGVRKNMSFAYSLPVAVIWSAMPGDVFASRKTQFLPTSTVHIVEVDAQHKLELGRDSYAHLGDVLRLLNFGAPDGITEDEVRKIYNYLHNRILGKAKGGEFSYIVYDEDFNRRDEADVPLSFRDPETLISMAREDWDFDPTLETAGRLVADTFIFADAPSVQHVAQRLGYDALVYLDVFQGGEDAAETLLGCDVEDLNGIEIDDDLEHDLIPVHRTLRPLDPSIIVSISSVPTVDVLQSVIDTCR